MAEYATGWGVCAAPSSSLSLLYTLSLLYKSSLSYINYGCLCLRGVGCLRSQIAIIQKVITTVNNYCAVIAAHSRIAPARCLSDAYVNRDLLSVANHVVNRR